MTHDLAGLDTSGDGRFLLRGPIAALCGWFDARFLRMAIDDGAVECRFPMTLTGETLERAGYFEAFPGGATPLAASGGAYWLPPAVCYHAYAMLGGQRIDAPVRLTAAQPCFREADRGATQIGRWWDFTMREVIFIGSAEWVAAERDRWSSRIGAFASDLGVKAALVPATDPFFGGLERGKRLLQQVKGLKYELRAELDSDELAVASFNLHETFFGRRFAMTLTGGAEASSACVAFGLERWALALVRQRGLAAARALTADAAATRTE